MQTASLPQGLAIVLLRGGGQRGFEAGQDHVRAVAPPKQIPVV